MADSLFTQIIKGSVPCHKVYEDDKVIAFLDINPLNPGHTLVVPKQEIDHIWDLSDEDYQYLMMISKKVAQKQREVLNPPRVGVMVEGFEISHAHIHIVPMYKGIRATILEHKLEEPDHDKLAQMAKELFIEGKN